MTASDEFPKLLDLAMAEATDLTAKVIQEHALDQLAGWSLDERQARLLFGDVRARYAMLAAQVVGVYEPAKRLWRWAWNDPSFASQLITASQHAMAWGLVNEIPLLTQPASTMDEALAWKLAAFTARLVGWPGIYRGDAKTSIVYIAFESATGPGLPPIAPRPMLLRPPS